MTENQLNQYFYLNKEIETITNTIEDLNSTKTKEHLDSLNSLIKSLEDKIENLIVVAEEIECYISTIESSDIRLIVRLRHISQLTWEEIGNKTYMSPSGVFKKYKKFMKENINQK